MPGKVFIDIRPNVINNRERFGELEKPVILRAVETGGCPDGKSVKQGSC
jgi:hypothetical protein